MGIKGLAAYGSGPEQMRYNWRPMESFLTSAGYGAIILFGFLEACCVPISSEITFGFAGVLAYQGHLSLALVIIVGTLAELAGSVTSFAVGRWGGRPLVDKVGKYVLITRSDVDRAERFLEGRGAWAVPVGRMIPVVRAFTSIVAGLIEMPLARFAVLSLIGTVVYVSALSTLGYAVGSAWHSVAHDVSIIGYIVVVLVVAAIAGFIVIRLRAFRREAAEQAAGPAGPMTGPRHRAGPPDGAFRRPNGRTGADRG